MLEVRKWKSAREHIFHNTNLLEVQTSKSGALSKWEILPLNLFFVPLLQRKKRKPFSNTSIISRVLWYACFSPLWDRLLRTVTLYSNTRGPIFLLISRYGQSIANKVSMELMLHYCISCVSDIQWVIDSLLLWDPMWEYRVFMVNVKGVKYRKQEFKDEPTEDIPKYPMDSSLLLESDDTVWKRRAVFGLREVSGTDFLPHLLSFLPPQPLSSLQYHFSWFFFNNLTSDCLLRCDFSTLLPVLIFLTLPFILPSFFPLHFSFTWR